MPMPDKFKAKNQPRMKKNPVPKPVTFSSNPNPPAPKPVKPVFNFQEFKKIDRADLATKYATATLGNPKGVGSTRFMWVFTVEGKKVALKVARSEYGYEQNEKEVEVSLCVKGSPYFTQIVTHDSAHPACIWLIMELAETPLDRKLFKKYTKIDFDTLYNRLAYGNLDSLENLYQDNKWIMGFVADIRRCKINYDDLHFDNWGQVDGQPRVLDYGW